MTYRTTLLTVLLTFLAGTSGVGPRLDANESDSELVREIYVPYNELLKITAKDPSGMVMTLAEYRELVEKARENLPPRADPVPPPPLSATALNGVIKGRVVGSTVHLRAEIAIGVATDGWVRCDLGPAPRFLGRLLLDDQPAWGLIESFSHGTETVKKRRVEHQPTTRNLTLILRGAGTHTAVLEFTLPVRELEDGWIVEGEVPRTAATSLAIDVEGRMVGEAVPEYLHTRFLSANGQPAHTSFEIALGSGQQFRLRWKNERGGGRPESTITVGHQVIYRLEPRNPSFVWKSVVDIHRKKTDRLVLLPPPATRVLKVRGQHVHSFREIAPADGADTESAIEIVLDRPVSGRVVLLIDGVVDAPSQVDGPEGRRFRFTLEPPRAEGAIRDHGFLAIEKNPLDRFADVVSEGLQAVAQSESRLTGPGGRGFLTSDERRHFAFSEAPARLAVSILEQTARVLVRSTHRIGIEEHDAFVQSAFRVAARDGRVYSLELRVPARLRLVSLEERGGSHGLRFELPVYGEVDPAEHRVIVDLQTALDGDADLVLDARLEVADLSGSTGDWRERDGLLVYPWLPDAETETLAVGLEVPTHFGAAIRSLDGWSALESYELDERRLTSKLLVAAVERERARDELPVPLAVRLEKRPTRGVYQAVVHAEARETELSVFVEIRLAVLGRPIEAIALTLPIPSEQPVSIEGPGIQERRAGDSGQRFLVFQKPWIGERFFQCRFDLPLVDGELPVPLVQVSPASRTEEVASASGNEALGVFHGHRFVVLRSRGGVELRVRAQRDFFSISPDEVPAFAYMRSNARFVAAFRVQERALTPGDQGDRSTIAVDVHPRRDLLERGVSTLELRTTIDRGGVSRTEASCVLKYAKEQYLPVLVEEGARILSVEVDGRSVRPVHDSGTSNKRKIPLPPRNYATLRIVYERTSDALEAAGTWREQGLSFDNLPVGEVRWTLFHPPGLRVSLYEPTVDSLSGRSIRTFARSFWQPMFSLQWPRWSTWESLRLLPVRAVQEVSLDQFLPGQNPVQENASNSGQQLVAWQQDGHSSENATSLPALHVSAEGEKLEIRKLGGGATIALSYEDPFYGRFIRAGVFLLAVLVGWILRRAGESRWLIIYLVGGLGLATFLPAALEWESPLFWIPFAEGLAALAIFLVALKVAKLAWGWLAARLPAHWAVSPAVRTAAFIAVALLIAGLLHGDETPVDPTSDDAVLIPYSLEDFQLPDTPDKRQVYIPYGKFVELWNLAYSQDSVAVDAKDLPAKVLLGNANYDLESDGTSYRATGRLSVQVYTREWTQLPLDFSGLQIESIVVDGKSRGVSYRNGVPFVPLQGVGTHDVRIALAGKVTRGLAEARVQAGLVAGVATRVNALLPAGIEVDSTGGGQGAPVIVETTEGQNAKTRCRVDLGSDGRLALVWRAPGLESDRRVTLTSVSDNGFFLELDGYHVVRRERVQIEGNKIRRLRYRVTGNWDVLAVEGADIAEWNLTSGEADGVTILEVAFGRRATGFEFVVQGFAPCGTEAIEPAGLRLLDSTRQEGFIGLRHHPLRRFPSEDALAGMERASQRALLEHFQYAEGVVPYDRLYHFHTDYSTARIRSVPVDSDGSIETKLIGLVGLDNVAVAARVFHRVQSGPGPIEYRTTMPAGWLVRSVNGSIVREWEVSGDGEARQLVIHLRHRASSSDAIEWYADGPAIDADALRRDRVLLTFPAFRSQGILRQSIEWALASPSDLQLGVEPETNMLPLDSHPRWLGLDPGWAYRMGFRSRLEDARLRVSLRQQSALVEATTLSTCRVESTHVEVDSRFNLDITRARLPGFRITLPIRARFVNLQIPGHPFRQEIERTDTSSTLIVHLPTPARQSLQVEMSYRLDRGVGLDVALETPRINGLQSSREVVKILHHALHPLKELEVSGLEEQSCGAEAWKSYLIVDPQWKLVVAEDEHPVHEGQDALVELAEIDTIYGADGNNWTIATYTILNRSRQFLEFELPDSNQLWRVTVDGRPVVVSRRDEGEALSGDRVLVPVERLQETDLSLQVALVYMLPRVDLPNRRAALTPEAPRLLGNIQTLETFWRVHVPDGYDIVDAEGNLSEVLGQVQHGKKVKGIMDQIRRIQTAGERASQRGKTRAAQNVLQLEQALSDALEDIDKESKDERNVELQIDREDRRQQEMETQQYWVAGNDRLNELQQGRQSRKDDSPPSLDAVDQAFEDSRVFMEKQLHAEPGSRAKSANDADVAINLRDLRGQIAPPIVSRSRLTDPAYQRVPQAGSKPSLENFQFVDVSPLDIDVPRGGRVFTFRRTAGEPELQVEVHSTTLHGFAFHWLGLLLTLGGLAFWIRRK